MIGFTCTHAYPHTGSTSATSLPSTLKGLDMVVYQTFKKLLPAPDATQVQALLRDEKWHEYTYDSDGNSNHSDDSVSWEKERMAHYSDEECFEDGSEMQKKWRRRPAFLGEIADGGPIMMHGGGRMYMPIELLGEGQAGCGSGWLE